MEKTDIPKENPLQEGGNQYRDVHMHAGAMLYVSARVTFVLPNEYDEEGINSIMEEARET